jgi:putative lipase involved disintegration of autophagic bodies
MDLQQRIKRRYFLLSYLDKMIEESIYYRNNNFQMNQDQKIVIANITDANFKTKIL